MLLFYIKKKAWKAWRPRLFVPSKATHYPHCSPSGFDFFSSNTEREREREREGGNLQEENRRCASPGERENRVIFVLRRLLCLQRRSSSSPTANDMRSKWVWSVFFLFWFHLFMRKIVFYDFIAFSVCVLFRLYFVAVSSR